jgi:hypothetical protein
LFCGNRAVKGIRYVGEWAGYPIHRYS